MKGLVVVFTLIIAAAAPANAGGLQFEDFEVRGDQNVWTYSVTFPNPDKIPKIVLKIPRSAYAKFAPAKMGNPVKPQEKVTKTTTIDTVRQDKTTSADTPNDKQVTITTRDSEKRETVVTTTKTSPDKKETVPEIRYLMQQTWTKSGTLKLVFEGRGASSQTITFEVIAPKRVTRNGEIEWTVCPNGNDAPCSGTAPGPVRIEDPIVLPMLSIGGIWRGEGSIDFKVENNAVLIKHKQEDNLRPSLSAGFLFNCFNWDCKYIQGLDFLLSLEFGVDGEKAIDGFVCGLGFRVKREFDLFIGVSMRTERELRPGFKDVAKQLSDEINTQGIDSLCAMDTKDNKINPEVIKWNFNRFIDLDSLSTFDGFPTIDPRDGKPIFYGGPLIDHTNWSIVFGVAVPVNIHNWIPDWIKTRLGG